MVIHSKHDLTILIYYSIRILLLSTPCSVIRYIQVFYTRYLVVEADSVDGYAGLSGVVLQSSSDEGLREEEPRYPEYRGDPAHVPGAYKLKTLKRGQRN